MLAVGIAALSAFLLVACSSAPAAAPTQPASKAAEPAKPAEPAKAADPTKAPAAAAAPTKAPDPTKAPAPKVVWPEPGKTISLVVGYAAGGSNDIGARVLAPILEKELGVPVQVVNKGGAATQVQLTELANAKPDGYTLGQMSPPTNQTTYLDDSKKAVYTGKSFIHVAAYAAMPAAMNIKADSKFQTLKDMVDAAKGGERVRIGDPGVLNANHLAVMVWEKSAGVTFTKVHFEGGAAVITAVLGGHIEAGSGQPTAWLSQYKSKEIRMLGVADSQRCSFVPDVPTYKEQGYDVQFSLWHGLAVPAGTPKEIVDKLDAATKKATEDPEFKKRMGDAGLEIRYLNSAGFTKLIADLEAMVKPLIPDAR